MPRDNIIPGQHPIVQDMALPGFYPCLTLQLNLTTYACSTAGKWVLTVRDPNGQFEVMRAHRNPEDSIELDYKDLLDTLQQALASMIYLHTGTNP